MSDWRWEREAELALRAVSTAVPLLRERPDASAIANKGSARDVVTAVDLQVERHLRDTLEPFGYAFLGEETSADLSMTDQPTWVVDPIDGTANWLHGLDWFAISLALHVDGQWPVGVVLLPARNELLNTWRGGAYFSGRTLRMPSDPPFGSSLVAAGFSGKNSDPGRRVRELEVFSAVNDQSRGVMRLGSAAANLAAVARGQLQVSYGVDAGLWDVAGGVAVAQALGLSVLLRTRPGNRCDYVVGTPQAAAAVRGLLEGADVLMEDS